MSNSFGQYSIIIKRDLFDGTYLYEARVVELPDVAEYGHSVKEVYDLAMDTIEVTVNALREQGRDMPSPIVMNDCNDLLQDALRYRWLKKNVSEELTKNSLQGPFPKIDRLGRLLWVYPSG